MNVEFLISSVSILNSLLNTFALVFYLSKVTENRKWCILYFKGR